MKRREWDFSEEIRLFFSFPKPDADPKVGCRSLQPWLWVRIEFLQKKKSPSFPDCRRFRPWMDWHFEKEKKNQSAAFGIVESSSRAQARSASLRHGTEAVVKPEREEQRAPVVTSRLLFWYLRRRRCMLPVMLRCGRVSHPLLVSWLPRLTVACHTAFRSMMPSTACVFPATSS